MEIARLLLERGAQPNMANEVGNLHNITLSFGDMCLCGICGLCVGCVVDVICMTNQI